jgi:hypothetical protein
MSDDIDRPRRPAVEPEIIPPERPDSFGWPRSRVHVSTGPRHTIYVSPLGPIGVALILLVLGLIAAALLLVLVGAVLIWIPLLVGLVVAGAVARRLMRR